MPISNIRSASSSAWAGWMASCGQTARSARVSARGTCRAHRRARGWSGRPRCTRAGRWPARCRRSHDPAHPPGQARRDVAIGSRQRSSGCRIARRAWEPASPPGTGGARGASPRTEARLRRSPSEHRRGRWPLSGEGGGARGVEEPGLESYDLAMFDLDGVVYVSGRAIDGVAERIQRVRDAGAHVAFVTNNASRTPEQVAAKLSGRRGVGRRRPTSSPPPRPRRGCSPTARDGAKMLLLGGEGLRGRVGRGRARAGRRPGGGRRDRQRLRARRALEGHHAGRDAGARRPALRRQQHRHDDPDRLRPRARTRGARRRRSPASPASRRRWPASRRSR